MRVVAGNAMGIPCNVKNFLPGEKLDLAKLFPNIYQSGKEIDQWLEVKENKSLSCESSS